RREALLALAKYGREETLKRVAATASREPDGPAIVERATRRTRALAKDDIPAFAEAVLDGPDADDLCGWTPFISEQLAQVPPDSRRKLELRIRAARLLGLGRARKSARALIDTIGDSRTPLPLRVEGVSALGRFGLPGTVDHL